MQGKDIVNRYHQIRIDNLKVDLQLVLFDMNWNFAICFSFNKVQLILVYFLFRNDGVVKTLHLFRCHKFSIISKYLLQVEMIENLRASNLKFFT